MLIYIVGFMHLEMCTHSLHATEDIICAHPPTTHSHTFTNRVLSELDISKCVSMCIDDQSHKHFSYWFSSMYLSIHVSQSANHKTCLELKLKQEEFRSYNMGQVVWISLSLYNREHLSIFASTHNNQPCNFFLFTTTSQQQLQACNCLHNYK